MSHLLKLVEWESPTGWHCNDTSDLAHGSGNWWNIPRMLNISLIDYVLLLKNDFNATDFHYNINYNVLLWKWKTYSDCHKFTLFINKEARKRKFFV